ncbi:M13 family metallopeptidase [Janibacter alkaliphilus]|uniref:Putative endopeptidase n=1 Tax=Janibacter alkaliphilus TaxID=1069963 RepID=A0A852X4Y4_9MICO|nr:M13-type metalloendopeptidase [Janibacter alkaliphilus]NYG37507.1 putative endopeptidase [Janibacter alkaliphilus]
MSAPAEPLARDPHVRPQDDLFGHVNNPWIESVEIPADRGRYGVFDMLRERSEEQVREIIEEVSAQAAAGQTSPDSVEGTVAALYRSFLDEERLESLGAAPIQDLLEAVAGLSSTAELPALLGRLARDGVTGALMPFVSTDDRDSDSYVVYLEQAGIGLPDESYYREEQHAATLAAYREHAARLLALTGAVPEEQAGAAAERAVALETRLAGAHKDRVANRDPVATYTKMDAAELARHAPAYDWQAWAQQMGAAQPFAEVVVRQPDYLTALSTALEEVDLASWQDWLRLRVAEAFAGYLHDAVVAERFDFHGRTLSGIPEQRARWKRGVSLVDDALGEAVGELYVQRHFPPAAKERMSELVGHLVEAFRRSFADSAWMGEETREAAAAKLAAFTPKVGHPETWRDYSALRLDESDLVGNVRACAAFEVDRNLGKLGGPVDRDEWFLTPQTVNAYYNPGMNEIVFPAAILQPPFFDADGDDADNFGGIGAVIGHEIGHGFDDAGSTFDGQGNLRDWWTAADREAFDARSDALVAQFDGQESRFAPGHGVNGALTVGENIGDIGGLAIGHAAYRLATAGTDAATTVGDDGLTGDQRFFVRWATVWCGTARTEEAVRLLAIDPHSPQDLRGNACRNIDAFHDAFAVTEGDGMWLPPGERVSLF